jgi:hypothetical protein
MWEDDLEKSARSKLVWIAAAITVAVVGFGGWQWYAAQYAVGAIWRPVALFAFLLRR